MSTYLYSHTSCVEHDPGPTHPECPERLRAVLDGLDDRPFQHLSRHEAPEIDLQLVEMVHQPYYVEKIVENVPEHGQVHLDPDTVMSPQSLEATRRSSGAAVEAVDRVMAGDATNAFCAVRPPGHHAESSRAMGFCLFNGAAIAAFHARSAHKLDRVAVIDFDVHHGNGTQHSFEAEPNLFYAHPTNGQPIRVPVRKMRRDARTTYGTSFIAGFRVCNVSPWIRETYFTRAPAFRPRLVDYFSRF